MAVNFPKRLIVAALSKEFFFKFPENNNGKPEGFYGKILEVLSQILGFQYQLTTPKDGEYGELLPNGNWTGLMGMVSKSEADIGINGISITQARLKAVDFTTPCIITDATFVTKLPGMLPRAYAYLYSFDNYTWMCIFALLFLMPLVFCLSEKGKCSYFDTLMVVFANLLSHTVSEKATNSRLLTVSWYFCAYVLSVSFAAVTASFLFLPLFSPPIKNFEELYEALTRGEFQIKVTKGTSYTSLLVESHSDHLVDIGKTIENNKWFLNPDEDIHEEVSKPGVAYMAHRLFLNMNFGFPPSTTQFIADDGCNTMFLGIALSKTFCCKETLDSALTRITEAGLVKKYLMEEADRSVSTHLKYLPEPYTFRSLSLEDLSGVITILVGGYVISFMALLAEIVYYKCCYVLRSKSMKCSLVRRGKF